MPRIHEEFASILAAKRSVAQVSEALLPRAQWKPYPTIADRPAWDNLPGETRTELIEAGTRRLGMAWPALKATVFLQFARNGNRTEYETPHFERRVALVDLVFAECCEAQGRFQDDIINGIWAILEESFWGVNAHNLSPNFPKIGLPDTSAHYVDLFAAETGALLAWVNYLLGSTLLDEVPQIPDRIQREIEERILTPYRTIDSWKWFVASTTGDPETGRAPNNWNPWIHSNILAMALLEESDPRVRAEIVHRCLVGIDRFLAGYFADGGCDEGTSYWGKAGASLFDCLEILESATGGKLRWWDQPLFKEIGRYIYRMHIGDSWYVNFADGAARTRPEAGLIYRYGERIGDPLLQAQGAAIERSSRAQEARGYAIVRRIADLFEPIPDAVKTAPAPLIESAWLPGLEVMAIREHEGSERGLFLAAKGGHNDESHNHNDVGSFIVGLDGAPLVIDVGVETYSKRTFGPDRYDIWTMRSEYHNLPTINGCSQAPGYTMAASDVNYAHESLGARFAVDIAGAYPPEAGITSWRRSFQFRRDAPTEISVEDRWSLADDDADVVFSLMTAVEPLRHAERAITLRGEHGVLEIKYDTASLDITRIPIEDARLGPVWGSAVWRTRFVLSHVAAAGAWTMKVRELPAPSA